MPLLRGFAPRLDTGAELLLAARLAQALGVAQSRDHHRRGCRGARHAARPLQLPQGRAAGRRSSPRSTGGGLCHCAAGEPVPDRCGLERGRAGPDAAHAGNRQGNRAEDRARLLEVAADHRRRLQRAARLDLSRGAARSATRDRWCSRRPPTTPAPATPTSGSRPSAIRASDIGRSGGLGRADPARGDAEVREARPRQLPRLPRAPRRLGK